MISKSNMLNRLLREPLLLSMRKSRDVYLIRSANKHLISNYDTFLAMNLTNKQIIHNIPPDIMELFNRGTDITINHH